MSSNEPSKSARAPNWVRTSSAQFSCSSTRTVTVACPIVNSLPSCEIAFIVDWRFVLWSSPRPTALTKFVLFVMFSRTRAAKDGTRSNIASNRKWNPPSEQILHASFWCYLSKSLKMSKRNRSGESGIISPVFPFSLIFFKIFVFSTFTLLSVLFRNEFDSFRWIIAVWNVRAITCRGWWRSVAASQSDSQLLSCSRRVSSSFVFSHHSVFSSSLARACYAIRARWLWPQHKAWHFKGAPLWNPMSAENCITARCLLLLQRGW